MKIQSYQNKFRLAMIKMKPKPLTCNGKSNINHLPIIQY